MPQTLIIDNPHTVFEQHKQHFLAQTTFPNGYVALKHQERQEILDQLWDTPALFEKYAFSPQGMSLVTSLLIAVKSDELEPREYDPHLAAIYTKRWKNCLASFQRYDIEEEELCNLILYYLAHADDTHIIDWEELGDSPYFYWRYLAREEAQLAEEQQSPYAQAFAVERLLDEHGWNFDQPEILEKLAELSFSPPNRLHIDNVVDQHFKQTHNIKGAINMMWEMVSNYLRTGGEEDRVYSADEIEAMDDLKIEWLVEGFFAKGSLSILSGAPKAGKSNLIRSLIYSMTTGEPWLSQSLPAMCKVVYYCLEDPQPVFKHTMEKLYERHARKIPYQVRYTLNPSHLLRNLKHDVLDGVEFMIIDTLFKAMNIEDSNSYSEVSVALDTLSRFAKQHRIHILLVHHNNKTSGGRGSSLGMLGSAALPAAGECNIILTRNEDTGERNLFSENRIPDFLGGKTFAMERLNLDKTNGHVWISSPVTKEQKKLVKDLEVLYQISLLLWDHPAGLSKKAIEDYVTGVDAKVKREQLQRGLNAKLFGLSPTQKKGGHPLIIIHPDFQDRKEEFQETYKRLTGESYAFPTDEQ